MDALPMAPGCGLDEDGLRLQLQRYRTAGRRARTLESDPRRLVVELAEDVSGDLVDELLAVERECCPFFTLEWEPVSRRLAVSVAAEEHEAALAAVAFALAWARARGASIEKPRRGGASP